MTLLSNSPATHCAMAWQEQRSCFDVLTKHRLAAGLAILSVRSKWYREQELCQRPVKAAMSQSVAVPSIAVQV